jgi:glycolate oxidase
VGLEKREFLPLIFSEDEMDAQRQIRDALDKTGLCNPLKVLPTGAGCVELRVAGRQVAL